ncbi:biotin--[acetyl-CoA-carboxylase] ligase [soil metagenome]
MTLSADLAAAPLLSFAALDSPNAETRRRAGAGGGGPLWITAAEQTAGRGRRGRAWSTRPGNLAATLLLTTDRSPSDVVRIAFVAALAVADLADAFVPPALVSVKWPNDVLVDGRKLSGSLIESGRMADRRLWLALGVGLNLAHAPTDVERPATALADHLRVEVAAPPNPKAALSILAQALARRTAQWEADGFDAVVQAWSERAANLGRRCVAALPNESVEGVAEALEPDGALRLRLDDGSIRRITAGDVFLSHDASAPMSEVG